MATHLKVALSVAKFEVLSDILTYQCFHLEQLYFIWLICCWFVQFDVAIVFYNNFLS